MPRNPRTGGTVHDEGKKGRAGRGAPGDRRGRGARPKRAAGQILSNSRRVGKPPVRQIPIDCIVADPEVQQRAGHIDDGVVQDYAEAMQSGAEFPEVVCFAPGGAVSNEVPAKVWLADGFHRVAAYRRAGIPIVPAELREGDARDALLYAVGANAEHGLKRTNEDKRRAVRTLLGDAEWCKWSDNAIAEKARVSPTFVGVMRKEVTAEAEGRKATINVDSQIADDEIATVVAGLAKIEMPPPVAFRTGRDNRTIQTGNIGKKKAEATAERAAEKTAKKDDELTAELAAERAVIRFAGECSNIRSFDGQLGQRAFKVAKLAQDTLIFFLKHIDHDDAVRMVQRIVDAVKEGGTDA